jgi:type I restriction enzyme S subunit
MNINEWQTAYLGDIAEVIDPHPSHRAPAEAKEGIPFAGIGDFYEDGSINFSSCRCVDIKIFKDHNARYEIKRGDIGFGRVASIGKVIQLREDLLPYAVSPTLAVIKPKGINPYYLIQFLKSFQLQEQIGSLLTGTTRSSLGIELLRNLIIVFPHSKEQTKITEVLSTVDKAISETEALIAKQQRIKTGLMQDLLTRGIDENGNLRSEETHQFKDSPLGRIPVEWSYQTLNKCLKNIEQGWSPDCEGIAAPQGQWGVLKTTSVVWEGYQSKENKVLPNFLKSKPQYEVKKGDVLMTRGGPNSRVGVVAYVYETQSKLILSDKIYRLKFDKTIDPEFIVLALSSSQTQRHLSTLKTGLAESQTNISQEIVKQLSIALPPKPEQEKISILIRRVYQQLQFDRVNLEKLKSVKTGLMQDLLTGKKRVTPLLENSPIS